MLQVSTSKCQVLPKYCKNYWYLSTPQVPIQTNSQVQVSSTLAIRVKYISSTFKYILQVNTSGNRSHQEGKNKEANTCIKPWSKYIQKAWPTVYKMRQESQNIGKGFSCKKIFMRMYLVLCTWNSQVLSHFSVLKYTSSTFRILLT